MIIIIFKVKVYCEGKEEFYLGRNYREVDLNFF